MYGRCISRLCSVSSAPVLIVSNSPVSCNSLTVALSTVRSPNGVAYLVCLESAHPGRYRACEGPRRKIRFAFERSSDLYAQAAAGPEYEYPACLDTIRMGSFKGMIEKLTHGAMMILAPGTGSSFPSIDEGTWASHSSSSLESVEARDEYHDPA